MCCKHSEKSFLMNIVVKQSSENKRREELQQQEFILQIDTFL